MPKLNLRCALVPVLLCLVSAASISQTTPKIPITPSAEIQKLLDTAAKLSAAQRPDAYTQAADAALKAKDYVGYDSAISGLRDADLAIKKPNDASAYLQAQIDAAVKAGDIRWQATAIEVMGEFLSGTGNAAAAVPLYEKALALRMNVVDLYGQEESLTDLCNAARTTGRADQAVRYYDQVLPITRALGDRAGEATALNGDGLLYDALGQKQKALDYYAKALPIEKEVGDRRMGGATLNNIGLVYKGLGQMQKALDYYAQALPIEKEVGDRLGEATTMTNIGVAYDALGQEQKALAYYAQALSIQKEVGDRRTEASTLSAIGVVYDALGQDQEALDSYAQSLPIRKEVGDRSGEANTLNNIAAAYYHLGQKQKALDYFANALSIRKEVGDRNGEASTLSSMGAAYYHLGQKQKALDYCAKALPIDKEIRDRGMEATTLHIIGQVYATLGQKQEALDYYAKALPIEEEVGDRSGEANTLAEVAKSVRTSCPLAALWFLSESVRQDQALRKNVSSLSPSQQRSFAETLSAKFLDFSDLLADQGRAADVQEALFLAKSDTTPVASGRFPQAEIENRWTKSYEKRIQAVAQIARKVDQLRAIKSPNPEQAKQLESLTKNLDGAEARFKVYLAQVLEESKHVSPEVNSVRSTEASHVMESGLASLPKSSTAIYVIPGDSVVHLLVVSRGHQVMKTVKVKGLNAKVVAFERALQDQNADPRQQGEELFKLLVKPIQNELSRKGVTMWSLNGFLRNLPIGALWDGHEFLAEKYPSCSFSPAFVSLLADKPRNSRKALVFGTSVARSVKDPITEEPIGFPKLPGVGDEAGAVGRILGTSPQLDDQFSISALLAGLATKPSVVHLASHFYYWPGDDRRSFLLTGDGGEWTVEAIKALPDNALKSVDLVTLSACATASGSSATGEETESFGAWMQRKGAKAVISTLWPIADASTSMLMSRFYTLRKSHPKWTKLQALRQAQLEMIHGKLGGGQSQDRGAMVVAHSKNSKLKPWPKNMPRYSHPYYWAPFVLTGNWQ